MAVDRMVFGINLVGRRGRLLDAVRVYMVVYRGNIR